MSATDTIGSDFINEYDDPIIVIYCDGKTKTGNWVAQLKGGTSRTIEKSPIEALTRFLSIYGHSIGLKGGSDFGKGSSLNPQSGGFKVVFGKPYTREE